MSFKKSLTSLSLVTLLTMAAPVARADERNAVERADFMTRVDGWIADARNTGAMTAADEQSFGSLLKAASRWGEPLVTKNYLAWYRMRRVLSEGATVWKPELMAALTIIKEKGGDKEDMLVLSLNPGDGSKRQYFELKSNRTEVTLTTNLRSPRTGKDTVLDRIASRHSQMIDTASTTDGKRPIIKHSAISPTGVVTSRQRPTRWRNEGGDKVAIWTLAREGDRAYVTRTISRGGVVDHMGKVPNGKSLRVDGWPARLRIPAFLVKTPSAK